MDNRSLEKLALEHGFAKAYFLPPPDEPRHDDRPSIVWNVSEHPWARVSLLLVMPYSPYPADERIPAYYINSNSSYHAAKALAKELESSGVKLLRCELPIKQLAVKYGVGLPCKSSLVDIPPYGTRLVFQSMLLGSDDANPFSPEEYRIPSGARAALCESCHACENACPAHAISEEGLDVKKCMRYYMDGADYPDWVYGIQRTHLGCEVCQQVCPRNAGVIPVEPPEEVARAFELDALARGETKPARLLVGKNFTGNGKLSKEAVHFLSRGRTRRP